MNSGGQICDRCSFFNLNLLAEFFMNTVNHVINSLNHLKLCFKF